MSNPFAPIALLLATLIMLVGWLAERTGTDPLPVESYAPDPAEFLAKFEAQGTEPVLRPPPGDVYMRVKRWEFSPTLELASRQTYRLHLLSEDGVHSAAIGEAEVLLEPGVVKVVTVITPASGRIRLQCGEYCGLGHTKMIGSIEVVP